MVLGGVDTAENEPYKVCSFGWKAEKGSVSNLSTKVGPEARDQGEEGDPDGLRTVSLDAGEEEEGGPRRQEDQEVSAVSIDWPSHVSSRRALGVKKQGCWFDLGGSKVGSYANWNAKWMSCQINKSIRGCIDAFRRT